MPRFGTVFFVLFGFAVGLHAQAQTYRVVGADGRVTFTDRPAADTTSRVSEVRLSVSEAAVAPDPSKKPARNPEAFRPLEAQGGALVMYSTEWCGYCAKARRYMSGKGIRYKEVDIEKDQAGRAEYVRLGGRGVPFFVSGSATLAGYSESGIDGLARSSR